MTFKNPEFFYLFMVLLPMIAWYILRQKKSGASIQFSSTMGFAKMTQSWKHYFRHLLFIIQLMVISLLIVVLARPQSSNNWQNVTTEGIDIVIALDISSSMLARDFQPDRLGAAKNVATEFISGRHNDKMGLVVFSGESFTQCPLTTDHAVLINLFNDIESGMIEDGTAIGNGLATAVSRLKESTAISRVVILLTDGENNRGEIAPVTAAELAKTFGIRVYTVGVGTIGTAPYPMQVQTPFGIQTQIRDVEVKIDEETLQKIADITDGQYFRATNNNKLVEIYQEIDKLEKSKIEVKEYSKKEEEFERYAILAIILLIMGIFLKTTIFRNIP
ncbi:MAG: aerotolerance regulator BatA [Bacteroidetes bacterium GWF2_42_66]|nr:MAG: aerotolerance regulator BatA [Bacteroidetes bacterium GWA2_42_15]OFY01417.1 MAG: aerotolerance regulator BatA [Bacteroidetes bacterium GWE2_42_39]OFY42258.1 MAG: aerotolerance regulator BatA [Bacteroidetes bacterium GWF2_42_66]HBL77622.1 aerotolerance regulator BatA [Prolixibacteraceae bacterium]HCB62752.1 aerotolerance regulator BatA [Bacteroidales bacterium]